jgi:hypothetical protein
MQVNPFMPRVNFQQLLCITFLLFAGIYLMTFGWTRLKDDRQLDKRSAVIEGRVIDGYVSKGMRGGQWSHLVVEYQPVNHAPIKRKFDVDGETYRAALDTRKATVTYLPEDPRVSRMTRFAPLPYQILIWFGGFIIVGGLICIRYYKRDRMGAVRVS